MMRAAACLMALLALAWHASAQTRVVTGQATVTGTWQSQRVHAVSNAVVATVQPAPKARREEGRQLPEKDTDRGIVRGPGRVPAAKRTR
jgi:hypothetical protein